MRTVTVKDCNDNKIEIWKHKRKAILYIVAKMPFYFFSKSRIPALRKFIAALTEGLAELEATNESF